MERSLKADAVAIQRIIQDGATYYWGGRGRLDVEVCNGRVVAVWLGCVAVPFDQVDTDEIRAKELEDMQPLRLHGLGIIQEEL